LTTRRPVVFARKATKSGALGRTFALADIV
jgi:hypothetical protein